jgi:hypothetical protein
MKIRECKRLSGRKKSKNILKKKNVKTNINNLLIKDECKYFNYLSPLRIDQKNRVKTYS